MRADSITTLPLGQIALRQYRECRIERAKMSSPIKIRMGGYGPPSTGFSKSLKFIGDRLEAQFGKDVAVEYVFNIMKSRWTFFSVFSSQIRQCRALLAFSANEES